MTALSPIKQRIVDIVRRAGPDGIASEDLFAIVYRDRDRTAPSKRTIRAHAYQLRKMGYPIVGERGGQHEGRYVLRHGRNR